MRTTLPVYDSKLRAYPTTLSLFSIIGGTKKGRVWFIQNHLGLLSMNYPVVPPNILSGKYEILFQNAQYEWSSHSWVTCWLIDPLRIDRETVKEKFGSILSCIMHYINKGCYLFFFINTTYIKDYCMWPRSHPIFVHGYDTEKKECYCSDFFGNPPKYKRKWIACKDIEEGFDNLLDVCSEDELHVCIWQNTTAPIPRRYGLTSDIIEERIHIPFVCREIKKYLNGDKDNIPYIGDAELRVGTQVYATIYNELQRCIQEKSGIDMTFMYVFLDHFTVLEMLLEELAIDFLPNNKITGLLEEVIFIKNKWSHLLIIIEIGNRYTYMKQYTRANEKYAIVKERILELKEAETEFLLELLAVLEKMDMQRGEHMP